jgi:hypothetical protein
VSSRRSKESRKPKERECAEALGALIANTRRVRRKLSLVEVAEWIDIARCGLGSLRAVGERIGLSEEMLRQFATVKDLSPKVKKLVAERKIDRVDVAHRLSKLPPSEQYQVATLVVAGELDSDDVRAVVALRRSVPDLDIAEVVDRVRSSRNIKEHVAYFPIPVPGCDVKLLRSWLAEVVGEANIRSLTIQGALGTLVLNSEGRKRLAQAARDAGLTKRKVIDAIVRREPRRR